LFFISTSDLQMPTLDFPRRLIFFLLYALVVVSFGLVLFFLFNSKYATAAISIACLILLLTGLRIAVFGGTTDNKVRLKIASASTLLLFAALQLKSTALTLATPFLEKAAQEFQIPFDSSTFDASGPLDYCLAFAIIIGWVIICYFMLRNLGVSPMGRPPEVLSEVLAEPTTKKRVQSLKANLRNKLEIINTQTQWSDANYVPLEAEVQILEGKTARRRVVDLLRAIRINPSTGLFIVLGEPGTGKSVALRTLAADLLGNSGAKDRIPIYINLKEWKTDKTWTPENKPTVADFHEFVFQNLLQEMDLPSQAFLKKNFDILLEKGFLFFIFDSFDEIPAVLDHDEDSWIINELSNCISSYMLSSRGVIASRLFRQPKLSHRKRTVLEIQPFSDDRIIKAVKIAANEPDRLIRIILNERVDLGTIARNPFLLHLIIFHFNEVNSAPPSQAAMFQTFINSNIESARRTLGMRDHSNEEIYQTCEDISSTMFEKPRGGLEIGELELRGQLDLPNLSFVLRFLVSARIGRVAPVSGAFSFSHRRFNEYFLVRRLQSKRNPIPFDSIQTDSRWRDALVLYAEIADELDAEALLGHAWQYAAELENLSLGSQRAEFVTSRNALRFIIEGFRNRTTILTSYRARLDKLISEKLKDTKADYIETKTVIEGLGLLDVEHAAATIQFSLEAYPGWISEQAVTAARYLPTIGPDLALRIYHHCVDRNGYGGVTEAKRQLSILSVSDAFREVSHLLRWFIIDAHKTLICAILLIPALAFAGYPPLMTALVLGTTLGGLLLATLLLISALQGNSSDLSYPAAVKTLAFVAIIVALFPHFASSDVRSILPTSLVDETVSVTPAAIVSYFLLIAIALPLYPRFWSGLKSILTRAVREFQNGFKSFSIQAIGAWLKASRFDAKAFVMKVLILATVTTTLFVVKYLLPNWLLEWIEWLLTVPVMIVVSVFPILAAKACISFVLRQFADMRDIVQMTKTFRPNRDSIARNFERLRTGWGRLSYVNRLEELTIEHVDAFKRADNLWPKGVRPQYGDKASMKLAQLDARWLGLD
jgi:hypothetical protein